ncbi:MAG: type II toxin-antitoxin system VapC family toxin [candidate division KSB1 bacterium]|nr:type II toxin-antitoxin system VapC family toxin [candidate division KSB1 bacterium]
MSIPLLTIFFDANVLIAGSFSQSEASFLLLQLCELDLLKGFTCKQAIDECREAIREKLSEAEPIFEKIIANSVEVLPNSTWSEMNELKNMAHRKDLQILAVAIKAGANYLVTFDIEDFHPDPALGLVVCKPGALLKQIRSKLTELSEK